MCGWFAGTIRRDFRRTLYMLGTSHCCDSSSCYSDTFEFEPASAGAERRTLLSERAVCALHSASNVQRTAASLTHNPNTYELEAANTRSCDRTCAAETFGCRRVESNEKRVYTLLRFPGVYNTWQHYRFSNTSALRTEIYKMKLGLHPLSEEQRRGSSDGLTVPTGWKM